jgi:hypothetical protein
MSTALSLERFRMDLEVLGERHVYLMPFWDGREWHMWLPGPDGLMEVTSMVPVHSDYLGKGAASDADLHVPFIDFMWQRASWPEVSSRIQALSQRFHHMLASVAKLSYASAG